MNSPYLTVRRADYERLRSRVRELGEQVRNAEARAQLAWRAFATASNQVELDYRTVYRRGYHAGYAADRDRRPYAPEKARKCPERVR